MKRMAQIWSTHFHWSHLVSKFLISFEKNLFRVSLSSLDQAILSSMFVMVSRLRPALVHLYGQYKIANHGDFSTSGVTVESLGIQYLFANHTSFNSASLTRAHRQRACFRGQISSNQQVFTAFWPMESHYRWLGKISWIYMLNLHI